MKDKNINLSSKIFPLFELLQIEVKCSENYFFFFLPQEAEASGKVEKEPQKFKKKTFVKFLQRIFALPAIQCK